MLDLIDHPSDHGTEFSADEIGAPARSRIHANLLQRHRKHRNNRSREELRSGAGHPSAAHPNQRISDPAPSLRGAQTAGLVSLASAEFILLPEKVSPRPALGSFPAPRPGGAEFDPAQGNASGWADWKQTHVHALADDRTARLGGGAPGGVRGAGPSHLAGASQAQPHESRTGPNRRRGC